MAPLTREGQAFAVGTCPACTICWNRNARNVLGLDVPGHCTTCGHILCPRAARLSDERPPGFFSAMSTVELVLAVFLLAGCTSGPQYNGLLGSGCASTNQGTQSLLLCAAGCRSDMGAHCWASCSAEWKSNGTTQYRNTVSCDDQSHNDVVAPLATGERLHWVLYPSPGDGLKCQLTITYPDGSTQSLSQNCLTASWGAFGGA